MHDYRGYTIGAYAIGGFFGSLASKYMNVWFGRRDNIMISCLWMVLGGLLSACAINIGMVNYIKSPCSKLRLIPLFNSYSTLLVVLLLE